MKTNTRKAAFCRPDRAQYQIGEPVKLLLHSSTGFPAVSGVRLFSLEREIPCVWSQMERSVQLGRLEAGSYGVRLETDAGALETAFDVVQSVKSVVRYGFLSDFSPEDGDTADLDWLCRLHVNTVQFYDWMYRHDRLLSPVDEYLEPIGRSTSLPVIRKKIDACLARGMRAFAYGAVYAATEETVLAHPDWAAYTLDGEAMLFAGWLNYMNISPVSGWSEYIINEFRSVVETLGFSGIHLDTYGFPKRIYAQNGTRVSFDEAFLPLINAAREAVCAVNENNGVTFNAVNDWPTERVAAGSQDALYIEVWPPHDTYRDLYQLISKAKRLAPEKSVVLAAYIKPFQSAADEASAAQAEHTFRLANAVILASGGIHLVHGEEESLLCDSYYAKHAKIRPEFSCTVVRYADYLVRYAPLLYDDKGYDVSMTASGGINDDVTAVADNASFSPDGRAGTVWMILRESKNRLVLHLINLTGNDALWNTPKNEPETVRNIRLAMRLDVEMTGVYCASPDGESLEAVELPYQTSQSAYGRIQELTLPELRYFSTIWIEWE
ncbi:MAG TPA: glycoside hydrolase family 66 protein [Candidatus Cryosericum sp.]|nr:glycoside hydrolase family 66 protein [Candidatus Cryosericum sp.]